MAETKYFGKYRAIVVDNDDPERRGRIRVQCPAVLGIYKSAWCEPCLSYATDFAGDYHVPPLSEAIWVEFEEGDVNKPIWNGGWYKNNSSPLLPESKPEDYRFISFKNSVLRMGDCEFLFELRVGDGTSSVLRVDLSTIKGLSYIGSKSEQELHQIETICVTNYDYFTQEIPESIETLVRTKLTVEDFQEFIEKSYNEFIEWVNNQIGELIDSVNKLSTDLDDNLKRIDRNVQNLNTDVEDLERRVGTLESNLEGTDRFAHDIYNDIYGNPVHYPDNILTLISRMGSGG